MEYGKTRGIASTHTDERHDMTQPHLTAHTAQDQAHHSARARYLWRTVVLNGTAASSGAVQDHCVARPIWCLATVASQVECSVASGPLDACGAAATKALEPLSWHRTAEPSHVSVSVSTAPGHWTALQHRTAWPSRAAAKAKAVSSPLKAASEVARDGGIGTDESVQQAHSRSVAAVFCQYRRGSGRRRRTARAMRQGQRGCRIRKAVAKAAPSSLLWRWGHSGWGRGREVEK